jgi:hypothetical protein
MSTKNENPAPKHASWSEQKNLLKAKFPTLSDTDLQYEESKKEEMFKTIQVKLGKSREELNSVLQTV